MYFKGENFAIYHGDNRQILPTLAENSVDAIVTDPPYELGFMGKSWDASGVAFDPATWREALRVLKPGGHLIAFSGSRTYHRMAVAIEDAGFEIRDQIMWIYGSGFPKSHNVSKGIDKNNGETDRLIRFTLWMRTTGLKVKDVTQVLVDNDLIGENGTIAGHYFAMKSTSQPAIPTVAMWKVIRPLIADVPEWVDELVNRIEAEREVVGKGSSTLINSTGTYAVTNGEAAEEWKPKEYDLTAPATPAAKQWDGWGTALKPAHEPMVLARKPLVGTVAANVLTYGTGGLNIDGARVGSEVISTHNAPKGTFAGGEPNRGSDTSTYQNHQGRWPANVIHDGSDEVVALFPDTGKSTGGRIGKKLMGSVTNVPAGEFEAGDPGYGDSGSAARFFYCAKASKRDRNEGLDGFEEKRDHDGRQEGGVGGSNPRNRTNNYRQNHHPTVKPTDLMRYLCRLITPPNGTVLDPFMGSGSTGKAAMYEGFKFIGIEMTDEYLPIAKARIEFAVSDNEGFLL
jgi:DNA modification methylase